MAAANAAAHWLHAGLSSALDTWASSSCELRRLRAGVQAIRNRSSWRAWRAWRVTAHLVTAEVRSVGLRYIDVRSSRGAIGAAAGAGGLSAEDVT